MTISKDMRKLMFSFVNTKAYQDKLENAAKIKTIIYLITLPLSDIIDKKKIIDYI